MPINRTNLTCLLTFTLLMPAITHAAAIYSIGGAVGRRIGTFSETLEQYSITEIGETASSGVLYFGDNDFPSVIGEGNSEAGITGLKAAASARALSDFAIGSAREYSFNSSTSANAKWSDFIITGPTGPSTVPISVNVFMDGTVNADIAAPASPSDRASASVQLAISGGGRNFTGEYSQVNTLNGGVEYIANGLLADFDGFSQITTPSFNVPVNTPFTIEFGLVAGALVRSLANEQFYMQANSNFSNTLTFAIDGPAFNLPSGYTINSVDAGVVNNAYVAIPEVSTMWLSALSVGVILVYAYARRQVRNQQYALATTGA